MGIAKKSTFDLVTQVSIVIISGIAGIIIARRLHPEGYGAFRLVLLANTLSLNLTNLGLSIANTYFIGKDPRRLSEAHTISVFLAFIFTITLLALVTLVGDIIRNLFFKDIPIPYLLIAIGLLPFSLYYAIWTGILIGLGRIILLSIFNLSYQFTQALCFIVLLVVFKQGLSAIIISWATIQVLAVFVMLYILRHRFGKVFAPLNFSLLKRFIKFGFTAYFGNVASNLLTRVDTLIVSNILGVASVGLYSLAGTLAEKLWLLPASMEKASYSKVIAADKDEAVFLIQKILRNTLFLTLLGGGVVFIFASFIIRFLYGAEYVLSAGVLRIFLVGVVLFGGCRIFAMYFTGFKGKPQIPTAIAWVMFAINATLCYLLTRRYAIWGAASATAYSYFVMFLIYTTLFVKDSGIKSLHSLFIINKDDLRNYWRFVQSSVFRRR
ncbi:oligosaccharide flippase family protein [Candidatus Sumerlaeota bacterium]|nr:oligosaccharide flippase family protein [Candidatus Sumerlaeota bacterium]